MQSFSTGRAIPSQRTRRSLSRLCRSPAGWSMIRWLFLPACGTALRNAARAATPRRLRLWASRISAKRQWCGTSARASRCTTLSFGWTCGPPRSATSSKVRQRRVRRVAWTASERAAVSRSATTSLARNYAGSSITSTALGRLRRRAMHSLARLIHGSRGTSRAALTAVLTSRTSRMRRAPC